MTTIYLKNNIVSININYVMKRRFLLSKRIIVKPIILPLEINNLISNFYVEGSYIFYI